MKFIKQIIVASIAIFIIACNSSKADKTSATEKDTLAAKNESAKVTVVYDSYCNARFGYCIDYPKLLVIPQPEAENSDGRVFTDKSDNEVIRVYGTLILDPEDDSSDNKTVLQHQFSKEVKEQQKDGLKISYQKLGKAFYVLSGIKEHKIYYLKTIENANGFARFILQYDLKDSAVYNPISDAVSKSFRMDNEPAVTPLFKDTSL